MTVRRVLERAVPAVLVRFLSTVIAGLVGAGLLLVNPPQAAAVSSSSVFNNPLSSVGSERTAIRDHVVGLIKKADPKSTIRLSMYQLWSATVARALTEAHDDPVRAVNVQVVLDEGSASNPVADDTYATLKASLGTDTSRSSFVTLCPKGKSCLGDPARGSSVSHNKFVLFSSVGVGTLRDVVVQTSSNLTPSSYDKYWNSATTVSENSTLHDAYVTYFRKLAAKKWSSWTYSSTSAGTHKAYFFPRAGNSKASDTIVGVLDNVRCSWSDSAGTHRTRIRLAMFTLTRQAVADKFAALRRAGCSVDIVYSNTDAGTWRALHFTGGPDMRCYDHDHDGNGSTPRRVVHSKYLLIDGWYAGRPDKVLWTGSPNYSTRGLRANDEALMKINDDATLAAYANNLDAVRRAAVPGAADNVAVCKS
ncbi:phospholipase D-like domain-containing protein [Streptomyces sp. KR80]|uniref:phospholipase D-like domain-containing protein n=1 Tax=Streptomyces sp. KR80 TaxID=3457426 RepID=UPI003FD4AA21